MITLEYLSRERLVLFILFVTLAFFPVIRDPDFYFHVTAGAYIIEHGMLPHQDVFSFTMAGAPWVMHEWLFEIVIYGLYQLGGDIGVKLFFAALIIMTLRLTTSAVQSNSVNFLIILTLLTLALLSPYLAPRPQLFSYLFFSFSLFALLQWRLAGVSCYMKWLPLLMLPWVNLHGGYLIGIVLIGLFIGLEIVSPLQRQLGTRQRLSPLLVTLLLTLAASAVNPYFIHHWLFPLKLMEMPYVQQISEWQAPDIATSHIKVYAIYLGAYLLLTVISLRQRARLDPLLPLPFIIASFQSSRHIPFALLSVAPLLLWQVTTLRNRLALTLPAWSERAKRLLFNGKPIDELEFRLNGIMALVIALSALVLYPHYHHRDTQLRNEVLPVLATDFLLQAGIEGRMFNSYRYGGYLLHRLYPTQRVFIDIRADMYDRHLHDAYETVFFARPGWRTVVDQYRIDYFIFDRLSPIAQVLGKNDYFAVVYQDSHTIVALRRIPKFAPLIARYGL